MIGSLNFDENGVEKESLGEKIRYPWDMFTCQRGSNLARLGENEWRKRVFFGSSYERREIDVKVTSLYASWEIKLHKCVVLSSSCSKIEWKQIMYNGNILELAEQTCSVYVLISKI